MMGGSLRARPAVHGLGFNVMSESESQREDRLVPLGRIVGVHGVRGEIKLESWTDPRRAIFGYQPWCLRGSQGEQSIRGAQGREAGHGLVASLPGIADREQARALIGAEILVRRAQLPPPAPGEYYWVDLEGLAVETVSGQPLGSVRRVLPTGANEVLEVQGERLRLIPFVLERYVLSIDLDAGRMVVDWDPDF